MQAQLFGEPATGGADLDEQAQRGRIFEQQHIVGGAAHRGFEQRHQSRQRQFGARSLLRFHEQTRDQRIQPRATFTADPWPVARRAHPLHQRRQFVGCAESGRREQRRQRRDVAAQPRFAPALHAAILGLGLDQRIKRVRYDRALRIERREERRIIGETHAGGDARPVERLRRQLLGLFVADRLQPMLDVAQESIGSAERSACSRDSSFCLASASSVSTTPGALQCRLPTRPDQLVHLRSEFDFADTARAEFHVVRIARGCARRRSGLSSRAAPRSRRSRGSGGTRTASGRR